jgi:class 3 adenylate cyclase/AmiR/NasT family two-component response regulator
MRMTQHRDVPSPEGAFTEAAPPKPGPILVVDDQPSNVALMRDLLVIHGYDVEAAGDGTAALAAIERCKPDLVLLDIVMPGLSGIDVCKRLRADDRYVSLPIVLMTSKDPDTERIRGLEAGADDFVSRPVSSAELLARVRSLIRVKRLFDRVEAQSTKLLELNENLQSLVREKVAEVERLSRLKRFFTPALAERILAGGTDDPLKSHRRDIAVVFFDLRGFTAFSESSAPEDVLSVLRELHQIIGAHTQRFGGTVERFVGDGVMVFFNDPEPVTAPCEVAADYALAVLRECRVAIGRWRRNGFAIDLGTGIAYGFASLGAIGFAERIDYGVVGTVANLGARLCAEANGGEVLVSARVAAQLPARLSREPAGPYKLKGFRDPVEAFRLVDSG